MLQLKDTKIKEEKARLLSLKQQEDFKQCTFRPDITKSSKHYAHKRTIEDLFEWERLKKQKLVEMEFESVERDQENYPDNRNKSQVAFEAGAVIQEKFRGLAGC